MADVMPEPVRWLWPGRLPAGMVSVLDGPPGQGKSSLVTDLVARITTGRPWPASADRPAVGTVILMGSEESASHSIRPRLDAAGADPRRVHLLTELEGGRLPQFPGDIAAIEGLITEVGACLLVVDPVSAFIGNADLHRDNEVRAALTPLALVAERTGCAILLLRHLRKGGGGDAIYRGLGSVAITALARASMMLLADPDDPSGEARILTWPKMSVARIPASIRWRFAPTPPGSAPKIDWDVLSCPLSADEILRRQDAHGREKRGVVDDVAEALRAALASGPVPSIELEQAMKAAGHSGPAYRRARAALGIRSIKPVGARTWLSDLPVSGSGQGDQHPPNQ